MDQFSMKIEIASTVLYINKHNFKAEDISKVSSFLLHEFRETSYRFYSTLKSVDCIIKE